MSQVFVTGGSGFLGGHIVRELVEGGHTVRALSRRSESDAVLRAMGATPVRASLDNPASLEAAMKGSVAVFHAAADTSMWSPNAAAQTATNVQGTLNMLNAALACGIQTFVHTSSTSAYSHLVNDEINEETPQRAMDSWINYERTKLLGEQAVRQSPVPWIVFQPSHILGPGDTQNWSRLIRMVDRESLPGIPPGSGAFADVRQIAKAQVRAWESGRSGQVYVVGGSHASFVDFVHQVGAALGKRTPKGPTPAWALMAFARVADAWSRIRGKEPDVTPQGAALTCHRLRVNSSKAERELGYVQTPLNELLADTLAWMRQEGMVGR